MTISIWRYDHIYITMCPHLLNDVHIPSQLCHHNYVRCDHICSKMWLYLRNDVTIYLPNDVIIYLQNDVTIYIYIYIPNEWLYISLRAWLHLPKDVSVMMFLNVPKDVITCAQRCSYVSLRVRLHLCNDVIIYA